MGDVRAPQRTVHSSADKGLLLLVRRSLPDRFGTPAGHRQKYFMSMCRGEGNTNIGPTFHADLPPIQRMSPRHSIYMPPGDLSHITHAKRPAG
jgi:hypothetical protein